MPGCPRGRRGLHFQMHKMRLEGRRATAVQRRASPTRATQRAAVDIMTGNSRRALPLTYFEGFNVFTNKRHILKNIVVKGETSAWIGPPGSGKSALMGEVSIHCGAQFDWRGHKAKEKCGVVYFALERGDLCKRRLYAHAVRDNLHDLPIAVVDAVIDLLDLT